MIQKIEELSMNALPALSTVLVNGWILRFANGYTKRANSINPLYPTSIDIMDNIKICDEIFRGNNQDTVFRFTEKEDNFEIDSILEKEGYIYKDKTNVMLKSISNYEIDKGYTEGIVISENLNNEWFQAFTKMNKIGEKNSLTLKEMLGKIIPTTYYCYLLEKEEIVAVGLGVAERGYVGIYDIYVGEEHRRKGFGYKIMENILYKAAKDGCDYSYLQVVDSNEKAKSLYDKLGYKKQYSYWYRIKSL